MAPELLFFDGLRMLRDAFDRHGGAPLAIGDMENLLRDPDVRREFFQTLERADWVTPLREAGYFDSPPKAKRVQDTGAQYPIWPESKYLARMAKHVPSEVAAIFTSFETDNLSIIGDMLDAALAMPAKVAASLVPAVCRAAQSETLWLYFKDASDLCVRLADGDEVPAAMTLAESLFTPKFKADQEQPSQQDEYWYKDGLKKVIPALASRKPHEFLVKLCDWLKVSVEAKKRVDPNTGSDYSYTWRPAIEEHEQNRDYDFTGVMVGFVRQGFEQAIRDGKMSLEGAIDIVDRYPYFVFKRIRLHLINEFAERNRTLVRRVIMDRDLFDDHQYKHEYYKHEYAMLVGRRLGVLTPEERDTWFGWIDAGPDMSDFDEFMKQRQGRKATDEDRQNRKQYWQFEKLHWVRKHLAGERRKFYEDMFATHGEPEFADLHSRISSGCRGNESPMAVAELTELRFEQAVERVSSWVPGEHRFMGSNLEGLASTFGQYVATNPKVFSAQAGALTGRPAIFVRAFINQMVEAIKTGGEIDVPAVLALCRWVLDRPLEERTTPEQKHGGLVEKDWQWTRDAISRLVKNICKATVDDTPKYPLDGLRESIWQLVSVLCRGRAQSYIVRDIAEDDPRVRDYLNMGINSSRGNAVEAALEYARWVANHRKKTDGSHEIVPGGFDVMSEVREMLEWQIAPDNRSFEALAVIGSRISLIYWIDKNWLGANAERLFRLEGIAESPPMAQGWAAWNAFLVWGRPHIEFYNLFREQFAYAVSQAARVNLTERISEQPMYRLGEHLMILYGRGELGLDDDGGLLRCFLADSHPDVRRHAVGFVGQSLEGDEKVPEEVVVRFQELWSIYWAGTGKKDAREKPDAWLFGTWFASGQFPEQWALEQLESLVEVTPTPEPDHAIAEQLAKIARDDTERAVRILARMIRGDREGWHIHGWLDAAKQTLATAIRAGGDARTQAEQVIDYLGRRGHTSFGDLLDLQDTTDAL